MHDEACTHYVDMVDQTTLGHQFILEEFGEHANPRIGWQLDPFGHSSTHAALLCAEAGFDALFFGRMDYQEHDLRVRSKDLQFLWQPSPSLGPDVQLYAEVSWDSNYNPPDDFCWDTQCQGGLGQPLGEFMQDRTDLEGFNAQRRVADFMRAANVIADAHAGEYASKNIMLLMGSDFHYQNAEQWMINLDKLITAVNANGSMHARYSTPSEYVAAKRAEGIVYNVHHR